MVLGPGRQREPSNNPRRDWAGCEALKEEGRLRAAVEDGVSSRTMLMALMAPMALVAGAGQTRREIVE